MCHSSLNFTLALNNLQDITLDKIFDEAGRKALCTDFAKLMEQVIITSSDHKIFKLQLHCHFENC